MFTWLVSSLAPPGSCSPGSAGATEAVETRRTPSRTAAIEALCHRLEIGPGAVIADVGCGEGLDTVVFARVVGESGTVLAQEIDAAKLKTVVPVAGKDGLHQITPVLGQSDDPRLPDGLANLIYMNRVFHHFVKPQPMLQRLWRDLKPGGLLVIVDQQQGPLTDWAPMESREDQHHWTGETTVVRLAREAGFHFHDARSLPWPAACFDAVVSWNVFHHLDDPGRVFGEMLRVLRPGGRLVLADFSPGGFRLMDAVHAAEGRRHPHPPTRFAHWRARLKHAGFAVRCVRGCNEPVPVARRPTA